MLPSPFPVLIIMIGLDGLASQTGFQRAVSPKSMYFCSLFPCYTCCSVEAGCFWKMAPFMVTTALLVLPLVYCSHMFVRTYVVISQCPHPGVNDACHMGEGGV